MSSPRRRNWPRFFLSDDLEYAAALLVQKGVTTEQTAEALERSADLAGSTNPFTADVLEPPFRALADTLGLKAGQLFMSIRVAVTGRDRDTPAFRDDAGSRTRAIGRPAAHSRRAARLAAAGAAISVCGRRSTRRPAR